MQIILLGGFLGSGKTSLLMSMANYLSKNNKNNQETLLAIIENEIGEVSIDNKLFEGGYKVSTLFSGCICCTLASDLTIALDNIAKKYNPDYTIIEATGLAYPDNIADIITKYAKFTHSIKSIVIVDAQRWEENFECLEILISGQIRNADIILLNKIDTVSDEEIGQTIIQLEEINAHAKIYPLSAKNGIEDDVWSSVLQKGEK